MKKQFNLQEYLANPTQKVETCNGKPARIVCTDANLKFGDEPKPILALITQDNGTETTATYTEDGHYFFDDDPCDRDLIIITEDEESDDSGQLKKEIDKEWKKCKPIYEGMGLESANIVNKQFNEIAHYFYNLGKVAGIKQCAPLETGLEEAIKDPFDYPDIMKWFDFGKKVGGDEVLKDLPKWKKAPMKTGNFPSVFLAKGSDSWKLIYNGYMISLEKLEKLPKEE